MVLNYRKVLALLGVVAILMGACMMFCLPWSLPCFGGGADERMGTRGLLIGSGVSFSVGAIFSLLGRGAKNDYLFRRDAIVSVTLSWILAILLGSLPYILSFCERAPGVPMTFVDALFESCSALTTTGATVFSDLDDPRAIPRTILFWRGFMQFLGGLGVMCFFVAILGRGPGGKTIMKLERTAVSDLHVVKMRGLAISLISIYAGLTATCALLFAICGMSLFDSLFYSFSVVSLGGLHAHNAAWSYFSDSGSRLVAIECIAIFFMVVAATNYWLLYWFFKGKPGKLFRDAEWRAFVCILLGAIVLITIVGVYKEDFRSKTVPTSATCDAFSADADLYSSNADPLSLFYVQTRSETHSGGNIAESISDDLMDISGNFRRYLKEKDASEGGSSSSDGRWSSAIPFAFGTTFFHTTSLMTGAGFAFQRYDLWNSLSLIIFTILMIVGGCSGSTSGGVKVYRVVLALKAMNNHIRELHSPNIARPTRIRGENVSSEIVNSAFVYVASFLLMIVFTTAIVVFLEPDDIWEARNATQIDKLVDLSVGTIAMYSNVGSGFGALSCFEDFGELSEATKFVFCWAELLGRLELWCVMALFSPSFWRTAILR